MRQRGISWRIWVIVASSTLLFVCMLRIPVASAMPQEQASGQVTAPGTPTVDSTVTALEKQKLSLETEQLQHNWENLKWNTLNNLIPLISTLILILGGAIGLWRWLLERQNDTEKRLEERFQEAIESIGDESSPTRQVAGAVMLNIFFQPRYKHLYVQTFKMVVANLQLLQQKDQTAKQQIAQKSENKPGAVPDPTGTLPTDEQLDVFGQTLVSAFGKGFRLAREQLGDTFQPAQLDASDVYLYRANIAQADLKGIRMQKANLQRAQLQRANLQNAELQGADLQKADLTGANLSNANLFKATLTDTIMYSVEGITEELRKDYKSRGAKIEEDPDLKPSSPANPAVSTIPTDPSPAPDPTVNQATQKPAS